MFKCIHLCDVTKLTLQSKTFSIFSSASLMLGNSFGLNSKDVSMLPETAMFSLSSLPTDLSVMRSILRAAKVFFFIYNSNVFVTLLSPSDNPTAKDTNPPNIAPSTAETISLL